MTTAKTVANAATIILADMQARVLRGDAAAKAIAAHLAAASRGEIVGADHAGDMGSSFAWECLRAGAHDGSQWVAPEEVILLGGTHDGVTVACQFPG